MAKNAGKLPKPEGDAGKTFNPFLRVTTISPKDRKGRFQVKLGGNVRPIKSDYGEAVAVAVTYAGKPFDWTMRLDSGNYGRCHRAFGDNPAKWRGTVNCVIDQFNGNDYIKIVD